MAKFISVAVHKDKEAKVSDIQATCERLKINFNRVMNGIFTNLDEALKTYNPTTHKADLNLGKVTLK